MIRICATFCLFTTPLLAETPQVVTDIAPIPSLTTQIMQGVGTPEMILPPGTDPHDFALRPSDAHRLSEADVIIWVGKGLTPWLEESLDALASDTPRLELLETDGWEKLAPREMSALSDDKHDEHDEHDEHDDEGGHNHSHGDIDPHAWQDPTIAAIWTTHIAKILSEADPENAATYATNAQFVRNELAALDIQIAARLSGFEGAYLLPHDGYQYFEHRYGIAPAGAVAGIDGRTPGPAQIVALRELMDEKGIVCVFHDLEITERTTNVLIEGTSAKSVQLDGLGFSIAPGANQYRALLTGMADSYTGCLTTD